MSLGPIVVHCADIDGCLQLYYPDGYSAANIVAPLAQNGIVVAGGLHKEIKGPLPPFLSPPCLIQHSLCR